MHPGTFPLQSSRWDPFTGRAGDGLSSLFPALALSVVLHAAFLLAGHLILDALPAMKKAAKAPLHVRLADPPRAPLAAPAPQPELLRREDTAPKAAPEAIKRPKPGQAAKRDTKKSPPSPSDAAPPRRAPVIAVPAEPARAPGASVPAGAQVLKGDAARKAGEQIARELFYPPEAIERGLEGEAVVLLFLDEAGNAIAARIESSSGHALLDQAAVKAARTIRSLPGSAPREALLPVRFRLR